MGVVERCLRLLLPRGRPWALAGHGDPFVVGLGVTLERPRTAARAVLTEARPGTAVLMLPEWCDALGVKYDPTIPVAEMQGRLDAIDTALGDMTLNELQAQINREMPGIVLSEVDVSSEAGDDECGVAYCGAGEGDYSAEYFDITGTLDDDSQTPRLVAILQRYSPLHLLPCAAGLTYLSLDETSEAGADEAMLAVAEGYGGVYVAPSFTATPTIHGAAQPGDVMVCMPGTVIGGPTPTLAYQWKLNTVDIPDTTSRWYTVPAGTPADSSFTCKVTATNDGGSADMTSAAILTVATPPVLANVTISLPYSSYLYVSHIEVSGSPPPSFTYHWYKDGSLYYEGSAFIFFPPSGNYYCHVIAANSAGSDSRDSNTIVVT